MSEDVPPNGWMPKRKPSIVVGDAEYLKALSGYKTKAAVAAWCTRNRIKFFRNGQGCLVHAQSH
jgi:hypothetical protein